MEENSNIQEEVKTEIKQENNQDDEIEILKLKRLKKKDFSNVLSGVLKIKNTYGGRNRCCCYSSSRYLCGYFSK